MTAPLTYTVEETAALIGIGRSCAYSAVRAGDIPSVKVGRRRLVPKIALERMLGLENDESPADNGALEKERDDGAHYGP